MRKFTEYFLFYHKTEKLSIDKFLKKKENVEKDDFNDNNNINNKNNDNLNIQKPDEENDIIPNSYVVEILKFILEVEFGFTQFTSDSFSNASAS